MLIYQMLSPHSLIISSNSTIYLLYTINPNENPFLSSTKTLSFSPNLLLIILFNPFFIYSHSHFISFLMYSCFQIILVIPFMLLFSMVSPIQDSILFYFIICLGCLTNISISCYHYIFLPFNLITYELLCYYQHIHSPTYLILLLIIISPLNPRNPLITITYSPGTLPPHSICNHPTTKINSI